MKLHHTLLLSLALTATTTSHAQNWNTLTPTASSKQTVHAATNVRSIFQDGQGTYWFGTDGSGLYRYDGHTLTLLTDKDGLCHNQIHSIQQDATGNIWLSTGHGICSYRGGTFTNLPTANTQPAKTWQKTPGDLWFSAGTYKGVYRYNGKSLYNCQFPGAETRSTAVRYDEYDIYCIFEDKAGNIWFGTQSKGVCRFNGKDFKWFANKGLSGAAVRAIFQDKAGNIWFGNNGYGLFRWNGTTLTNLTEEKGLSNTAFINDHTEKEGTLARVWDINQDTDGHLWIATIDAGLWRFDGRNLTNYTTAHGLPTNSVTAIYKDKKGQLWFGTVGDICKFNGKGLEKVVF